MTHPEKSNSREGYCPVYDIECPSGSEAAASCENRFSGDYNPLTSFRDADIEHCALFRKEQADQGMTDQKTNSTDVNKSIKDGE